MEYFTTRTQKNKLRKKKNNQETLISRRNQEARMATANGNDT